jgi:hypothetical protein
VISIGSFWQLPVLNWQYFFALLGHRWKHSGKAQRTERQGDRTISDIRWFHEVNGDGVDVVGGRGVA